jgi:hypothetical protein
MKNALVLEDHFGDDGSVTAGMILKDITGTRFDELEKKGLVREATDKEVKAGHQHAFEKDETEKADEGGGKEAPKPTNKQAPKPENKGA